MPKMQSRARKDEIRTMPNIKSRARKDESPSRRSERGADSSTAGLRRDQTGDASSVQCDEQLIGAERLPRSTNEGDEE
jgi:hypothetical protein